jgi:hypothetical protein
MTSQVGAWITILVPLTLAVFMAGIIVGRRNRDARDLSGPPAITPARPASSIPLRGEAGSPLDPATRAGIEQALAARRKIEAIKLLREATGMGLKEAKEAVEQGRF